MKIVIFFHFDCFPDKYTNSEVNTCIANVLQRAPNGKGGGGTKEANPPIIAMDEKKKRRWGRRRSNLWRKWEKRNQLVFNNVK